MKLTIKKKLKFIQKFQNKELRRLLGRTLYSELRSSNIVRYIIYINYLLIDYYLTKKNLFCFFSYKFTGIVYPFKMYRMTFRKYCFFGLLSGIRKASW